MMASIQASGIGIRFLFDHQRRSVTPGLARLRRRGKEAWGLRFVDLEINGGEGVALLGPSGSGKTTLLRTFAGVLIPDEGTLEVRGWVGSLLSVEAGLLSRLTGRENATLLGVLAGMRRREVHAALEDIKLRSDLGDHFDRTVSSFSQGMRARLGFTVAERRDPDILLLDEVHEALDHEFREIVEDRARQICERGGIVVAAGHDHEMLARLCDRAVLLVQGAVCADGEFEDVRRAYVG